MRRRQKLPLSANQFRVKVGDMVVAPLNSKWVRPEVWEVLETEGAKVLIQSLATCTKVWQPVKAVRLVLEHDEVLLNGRLVRREDIRFWSTAPVPEEEGYHEIPF